MRLCATYCAMLTQTQAPYEDLRFEGPRLLTGQGKGLTGTFPVRMDLRGMPRPLQGERQPHRSVWARPLKHCLISRATKVD